MFKKQSHVDPSVSSGTSPTTSHALSAEELHLFAEAMQRIFDEPATAALVEKAAA